MMMNNTEDRLVKVPPSHVCDVCEGTATLYHTGWYIHLCSKACLYEFESMYKEEIDSIAIKRLKGDSQNAV